MLRLSLCFALFVLCLLPVFATNSVAPYNPIPPVPCTNIAVTPPITGIVTYFEPHAQFAISLGTLDGVNCGAQLQIFRCGLTVGSATVIHVDPLDSVAELTPDCNCNRVIAGDQVVVTCNPAPTRMCKLPWYAIYPRDPESELAFSLLAIAGVWGAVVN